MLTLKDLFHLGPQLARKPAQEGLNNCSPTTIPLHLQSQQPELIDYTSPIRRRHDGVAVLSVRFIARRDEFVHLFGRMQPSVQYCSNSIELRDCMSDD